MKALHRLTRFTYFLTCAQLTSAIARFVAIARERSTPYSAIDSTDRLEAGEAMMLQGLEKFLRKNDRIVFGTFAYDSLIRSGHGRLGRKQIAAAAAFAVIRIRPTGLDRQHRRLLLPLLLLPPSVVGRSVAFHSGTADKKDSDRP